MRKFNIFNFIILCLSFIASCDNSGDDQISSKQEVAAQNSSLNSVENSTKDIPPESGPSKAAIVTKQKNTIELDNTKENVHLEQTQRNIVYGRASLADVRQALTDTNASSLTNTMHALYAMRKHRGVYNLLFDMWKLNKAKYPELAWEQISKAPARIALASTINRVLIINTDEYKDYIRSFSNDKHEFHLAQVVISLGFNGSPDDVDYIKNMAEGENHYVAQSAITALAIMGGNIAQNAMLELYETHKDTPRGELVKTLLKQAYDWEPPISIVKAEEEKQTTSDNISD